MAKTTGASIVRIANNHLLVEELRDELVVYDRKANRAHLLDERATAIFKAAAEPASLDTLASLMPGTSPQERESLARLAISDLERAGLVVTNMAALPRRGLLKSLGSAVALPMVVSILAPAMASAQSCATVSTSCSSLACCGGLFCSGGTCCANNGQACTTNGQCCGANCSGGLCVDL
jgi:hypothetical protein